jgi:exonuclease SbcD
MHEFVICADVHEGKKFDYRIDPRTGLSERELDIHKNFKRIADFALDNNSKYLAILGDLFDKTHVAPIYRRLIREDVIEPLSRAGINIWVLAGNHDQPKISEKGTSIDDFKGYKKVTIFREPKLVKEEISGKRVAFLIFPYLDEENIISLLGGDVKEENMRESAKECIRKWTEEKIKDSEEVDCRVFLSHYWVEGAKVRDGAWEIKPGEFNLDSSIIPEVNFAFLGHIHKYQMLHKNGMEIVYPGSVERMDWGEKNDEKGFISFSPGLPKWEFIRLPSREMIQLDIKVNPGEDPEEVLSGSLPNLENKLIRLKLHLPEGGRSRLSMEKVGSLLSKSFHREIKIEEEVLEKEMPSFSANPYELFEDFIETNYSKNPLKEKILKEGREILGGSLE